MSAARFHIGDVIRTRGGRTPWRIDSIGLGSGYYDRQANVYRCTSLLSGRHEEYRITNDWIEAWTGPLPAVPTVIGPVKGHGLQHEGGPFTADGVYANSSGWDRSGEGRALCACGTLSDVLPSASARKRWHKEHKAAIRAEQTA